MRKLFFILAGIMLLSSCETSNAQEKGYKLKIQIEGINNDTIYLANYFGNKLYYADTAYAQGDLVLFEGDSLSSGKYAVILPGVQYFEIILAEPFVSVKTKKDDFLGGMEIIESRENKVFYNYVHYLADRKKDIEPYEQQLKEFEGTEDEKKAIIEELKTVNSLVLEEQKRIVENNEGLLVAKYINMSIKIDVPDPPKDENGIITDSSFQRRYYVNHYFDHFDFDDNRIVRDPVFYSKINEFFTKVVYPVADSINYYGDVLIAKTNGTGDNFKFIAHYLISMYDKQKRMGLDAVFVHMVENYYMNGQAFWLDSAGTAKLTEKAMTLKPILIGKKAPYLNLYDTTGTERISLYEVNADYTILYFWASDCGHCQKSTPKLLETYHKFRDQGVEVYAVGTELENDDWVKYIKEHEFDFINVSDVYGIPDYFRTHYDIFATPKIFILDKDKIIIAKDLGVEQVDQFLEFEIKKKG